MKLMGKKVTLSKENIEPHSKVRTFKVEVHVESKPEEVNGSIKSTR